MLTKYGDNDFVIDDDIVKAEILLFETTKFDCNFASYTYNSELRYGYYKGNCGSISSISSTNNWALDTFFVDKNNPTTLIIHRGFSILNYDKNSLNLKIRIKYKKGIIGNRYENFEFDYSWGDIGFQGWLTGLTTGNYEFINFFFNEYSSIRSIELNYYGALL